MGGYGTGKGHEGRAKVLQPNFRGVCVPGEFDSVLGDISFAVALTKSYQKKRQAPNSTRVLGFFASGPVGPD